MEELGPVEEDSFEGQNSHDEDIPVRTKTFLNVDEV